MATPRKLPTFEYQGKVWTVDERLGEFRHVVLGDAPEFVPFDSTKGVELLTAFLEQSLKRGSESQAKESDRIRE